MSIEQDYYEFETNNLERMRWHYCHYTEEYNSGYVLHVYFNSLGKLIESCITETNSNHRITTELCPEQQKSIAFSLERASELVAELIRRKRQASNDMANNAVVLGQSLLSKIHPARALNAQTLLELEQLRNKMQEKRMIAQRYADNLLIFDNNYINTQLEKLQETEENTPEIVTEVVHEISSETTALTAAFKEDKQTKLLRECEEHLQSFKQSPDFPLQFLFEIQSIKSDLIFAFADLDQKQRAKALEILGAIEKINFKNIVNDRL